MRDTNMHSAAWDVMPPCVHHQAQWLDRTADASRNSRPLLSTKDLLQRSRRPRLAQVAPDEERVTESTDGLTETTCNYAALYEEPPRAPRVSEYRESTNAGFPGIDSLHTPGLDWQSGPEDSGPKKTTRASPRSFAG